MSGTKKRKKTTSKRKSSVKGLKDSFQKALSGLPAGIAIISKKGIIEYANTEFGRVLGSEIDDLSGVKLSKLISLNNDIKKQLGKPVLDLEQPIVLEIDIGHSSESKTISFTFSPHLTNDISSTAGQIVLVRDITAQRLKEKELERVTHEIVCLRNVTILLADTNKTIDNVLYTFIHMILEGWQYPEITCAQLVFQNQVIQSGNFKETPWFQTTEVNVYGKTTGSLSVYYLEEMPKMDEGPFMKTERFLIDTIALDLGIFLERRQSEQIRKQQQKELELYSSLIRHDLKNDVGVILGNTDLVRMITEEKNTMMVEVINSTEAVCERMMNLLSAFSRPTDVIETNLVKLIQNVSSHAQEAERKLTVKVIPDSDASDLSVSESRLLPMVFENLLRNSAVHAGDDPVVQIHISRKGNIVEIIVSDDGPGVSEEVHDRLFQKGASTRGGGLGLYLSREVINAMGGKIELIKSKPNVGATFRIHLPLAA
ncbi:MAG: ATP-binding protein [Candidatus Thorarchaeota archaeon]